MRLFNNLRDRLHNSYKARAVMAVVMTYALFLLAGLLITFKPAYGQDLGIAGYYEHTLQVDYQKEIKEILMDASKLRLDFSSSSAEGLSFNGNLNFIVYHSAVRRDISPFLPPSVSSELQQAEFPTVVYLPDEHFYLDNAYLSWQLGDVRLRAGKQQLSWGPAYSFNPTDLFHKKNQFDPTYEKEGVTALRLDYRWGFGGQFVLIAAPGDNFGDTGYALRLGTHLEAIGYDLALTIHSVTDSTALDPDSWSPYTQLRRAVGLEFSGEFLGLGLWFEGNYNAMEVEENFSRMAFGTDYTLDSGLYLMAEALYNGRAESDTPYPVHDWLAYIMYGEPVGPWWYLVGVSNSLTDLSTWSCYFFGTSDGSLVLNPRLDISIGQNADMVVYGGFTFGDEEGAFPPGLASMVTRITVWF